MICNDDQLIDEATEVYSILVEPAIRENISVLFVLQDYFFNQIDLCECVACSDILYTYYKECRKLISKRGKEIIKEENSNVPKVYEAKGKNPYIIKYDNGYIDDCEVFNCGEEDEEEW